MRVILTFIFLAFSTPLVAQSLTQNDIMQVQGLLADMGYRNEVGSVDGIMGSGTSSAIAAFQRETGITVTGQPSLELIERLRQLHRQGWDRGQVVSTGPSFDCGRASTPTEHTICNDQRLSRLDRDVAQAYASALARSNQVGEVRATQRRWIDLRNDCGTDRQCLDNAMTGQIQILNGI